MSKRNQGRANGENENSSDSKEETEREWFEVLLKEHGPRLGRYFSYRLRGGDAAHDLVTETFLRAWKSRKSFRGEAKASTWLWTIGHRVLANYFKQRARRDGEILTDEVPEESVDGREVIIEKSARQRALIECISALNERIQRSVELVWLLGHSYVEAANIMSESPDTVRMRLKRVQRPLQECLIGKGILGSAA